MRTLKDPLLKQYKLTVITTTKIRANVSMTTNTTATTKKIHEKL
jgi:hypothetical protein